MSAQDPANDGTFEILDDLSEHVRQRYVEKLSKEELAAIVVAVWRERDEAARRNKTKPGEPGQTLAAGHTANHMRDAKDDVAVEAPLEARGLTGRHDNDGKCWFGSKVKRSQADSRIRSRT